MDDATKAAKERRMADLLVRGLPESEQNLWREFKHTSRFHIVGTDRVQLRQRTAEGSVEVDRFDILDPALTFDFGLELTLRGKYGRAQIITHHPRLLLGYKVFVWIPPYFSDVRFLQGREGYRASMNIAFRSAHAPDFDVEGNQYLLKA